MLGTAAAAVLTLATTSAALGDAASDAATIEQLKKQIELLQKQQQQQIETLQRQVDDLQKKQAETTSKVTKVEEKQEQVAPAQVVTGGDFPKSFKLPGTDTSVSIYGYAKADFIYDLNGKLGDSVFFSTLPFKGSKADKDGGFRAHAKQSRIGVETRTPTDWGEFKTVIEVDAFGGGGNETFSNSSLIRLRKAYGTLGPVLIGQEWTTFMDIDVYPWTVDFFGPVGITFLRQVQARYTHDFGQGTSLAFAIENSEPDFVSDTVTGENNGNVFSGTNSELPVDNEIPDFILRGRHEDEWGWVQLSGVGRLLKIDDGVGDDSAFGYGLFASGVYRVTDSDTIGLYGLYGDGIGRYNVTGGGHAAAVLNPGTPDLKLETQVSWGAGGWYQHNWRENLWSVAAVGYTGTDFDEGLSVAALDECGVCNEEIFSLHVNTFWEPIDNVLFGVEYIRGWGEHETLGDRRGNRIQFATQYNF
jgi:hypothetical protein